jgi:hypothetical protein
LSREKKDPHLNIVADILKEFLEFKSESVFYRTLVLSVLTSEYIEKELTPIIELAKQRPKYIFTVFMNEVNTSSWCI